MLHRTLPALTLLLLTACASNRPFVWVQRLPAEETVRLIRNGDTIAVAVKNQKDLSGTFVVRENGAYPQPVVGEVAVAGLSEPAASKQLVQLLAEIVVKPQAAITVVKPRPVNVAVVGEVRTSGQFQVQYDASVLSVLARAGGLSPFASRDNIYVVRKRPQLLRIRFRYDDLKGGDPASTTFRLRDGDVLVVE
ncbi:MAG: polysaccharide biosynthesis/export family protein [Myxococcota bacterium]